MNCTSCVNFRLRSMNCTQSVHGGNHSIMQNFVLQFMTALPSIHEIYFNSCNRQVAIHSYSVLRAITGSFFAAALAGIRPLIKVSPTLTTTINAAD